MTAHVALAAAATGISDRRAAEICVWVREQLARPEAPTRPTRQQEHVIRTVLANDEALKRHSRGQATA